MTNEQNQTLTIVGAGPIGCVLATLLARRGFVVEIYEKRADMRQVALGAGRSINLVLTRRGLRALERIGVREAVLELTVPVLGRMMHGLDASLAYQAYGKDPSECNYSVSRSRLNEFLLDAAEAAGVRIHFGHALIDADFDAQTLHFESDGQHKTVEAAVVIGCDGAPSGVRRALVEHEGFAENIAMMGSGYKELFFPPAPDGTYAMAGHALHIWPRGHHFLMGLANLDGSFTGTLYLPVEGPNSFESLQTPEHVKTFFERHYPDAIALLDNFTDEFLEHPMGQLGTVRVVPWHLGGRVLLVGDAAHGIVPFFGQGLNAGFEDCVVLDELFATGNALETIFETFSTQRKPHTDAIADLALENFVEMSEKVGDPGFLMRKKVEAILERELGDVYRSRYAMVMYSYIPYGVAFEIGQAQQEILATLTVGLSAPEHVDLVAARRLIAQRLEPLYARYEVDLGF
ncbi:MAG: FAD-dependent monooxygenase [Bradymonadaceae bacterium]|nr:FAD-dependent monooxygenase [Lujinxingiaceae bacterium]